MVIRHSLTAAGGLVIAGLGAALSSALISAFVAGFFLLANTVLTVYLTQRAARERKRERDRARRARYSPPPPPPPRDEPGP